MEALLEQLTDSRTFNGNYSSSREKKMILGMDLKNLSGPNQGETSWKNLEVRTCPSLQLGDKALAWVFLL